MSKLYNIFHFEMLYFYNKILKKVINMYNQPKDLHMAIIETKKSTRPNTSIEFVSRANAELNDKITAGLQQYIDSGKLIRTRTVSDDNLTETLIYTFDSLDTFSKCDTVKDIDLDQYFMNYLETNGFPSISNFYKLEGIDSPFSCVVKYNFPEGTKGLEVQTEIEVPIAEVISRGVANNMLPTEILQSVDVNTTSVTVTTHYSNSAEFTQNLYNDITFVKRFGSGVTRTITYTAL